MHNLKIIFMTIVLAGSVFGQNFDVKEFVTLQGDNYCLSIPYEYLPANNCELMNWINKNGSVYSLYVEEIVSEDIDPVKLYETTNEISYSLLDINYDFQKEKNIYKIYWSEKQGSLWRVNSSEINENVLENIKIEIDSLTEKPEFDVYKDQLVWVKNGNLYLKKSENEPLIIDSNYCSEPKIHRWGIVYTKKDNVNSKIIYYTDSPKVIDEGEVKSPEIFDSDICYLKKTDGVWKLAHRRSFGTTIRYSSNKFSNFSNPDLMCTWGTLKKTVSPTEPYLQFITVDSDSLGEKDVFYYNHFKDSLYNISNLPGEDYNSETAFYKRGEKNIVGVYWIHEENNKKDIYYAEKEVEFDSFDGGDPIFDYTISQNYPNPCNGLSEIKIGLPYRTKVKMEIFDLLGQKIKTVSDGIYESGYYVLELNLSSLSSGIYFCRTICKNLEKDKRIVETKKIMVIK